MISGSWGEKKIGKVHVERIVRIDRMGLHHNRSPGENSSKSAERRAGVEHLIPSIASALEKGVKPRNADIWDRHVVLGSAPDRDQVRVRLIGGTNREHQNMNPGRPLASLFGLIEQDHFGRGITGIEFETRCGQQHEGTTVPVLELGAL